MENIFHLQLRRQLVNDVKEVITVYCENQKKTYKYILLVKSKVSTVYVDGTVTGYGLDD
jgi:hypothetical protein